MTSRLAVVDLESTGLDPTRHSVFELGLIVLEGKNQAEQQWWFPVDLDVAEPTALRLTRYYEREPERSKKSEAPAVARVVAKLTANINLLLIGSYHERFLEAFLRTNGVAPAWRPHPVDIMSLVAGKVGLEPPWDTASLSKAAGVELPAEGDRHSALADCRWMLALYAAVFSDSAPAKQKPGPPGRKRIRRSVRETTEAEATDGRVSDEAGATAESSQHGEEELDEDGRPTGMPKPGEVCHCEDCGKEIDDEQARFSWTRWRHRLCEEHHASRDIR